MTGEYRPVVGELVLVGLSSEDATIAGGFACGAVNLSVAGAGQIVELIISENLRRPICVALEPDLIAYCEP